MSSVGKPKTTGFKRQDSNDGDSFEDDFKFYLDQKGPRMQQLGPVDAKLTCKENAKIRTNLKRKHVPQDDAETSEEAKTSTSEEGEWSQEEDTSDETFNHTPTSKPSDLVNLSFSKKSLLRNSAEEALRLGLSHREHVMMTAKFVKMGGGSLKDVALSVTTSHRHRKNVVTSKTEEIKYQLKKEMPKFVVLHWDSKLITVLGSESTEDRLCVIASFPGTEKNDQFLGSPQIPNGKGDSMRDAVIATQREWEIPDTNVIATCWDTTASNSGKHIGAAKLYDVSKGAAHLWLACRHHIGERHVTHANFAARNVATSGPDDKLFNKFSKMFSSLPLDQLNLWVWPNDNAFLTARGVEVLQWAEAHLLSESFGRDDYRELCELIVHFLGGNVVRPRKHGDDHYGFTMRKPGAHHHARFMSKCLYLIKITMLSDVLPEGYICPEEMDGIKRMTQYICLFHGPHFLKARLAAEAPGLDLELYQNMCQYALIDPEVSDQVKNSIYRQQWYLTEELIVLSLFDTTLSNDIRASIAHVLLQTPKPATYPPAKPDFRNDILEGVDPHLQSFVGSRSWLLFRLLGFEHNHEWLTQLPTEWPKYQEYIEMNDIVLTLQVVNDNAEREIKKVQEYAMSSLDGELRQNMVIVSNSHRAKLASFLKQDMEDQL